MSLSNALSHLRNYAEKATAIDITVGSEATPQQIARAKNFAAKRIRARVKAILRARYDACGLKTRSGMLLKALDVQVWYSNKLKGIVIGWKSHLPDKVYVYGSALNYGAVYGVKKVRRSKSGGVGTKLKRYGGKRKQKIKSAFYGKAGSTGKNRVTKAWGFFQLSATEQAELTMLFEQQFELALNRMLQSTNYRSAA